jgi:hypothetical protein
VALLAALVDVPVHEVTVERPRVVLNNRAQDSRPCALGRGIHTNFGDTTTNIDRFVQ